MRHHRALGGLAAVVAATTLVLAPAASYAAAGQFNTVEGGADTVGSDYSDLVIVLRDTDGTPLLTKFTTPEIGEDGLPTGETSIDYCVQPVSYDPIPGVAATTSPVDGREVYLVPLQGQPGYDSQGAEIEPCDPWPEYGMFVNEVELERLNMARTSDKVIDDKVAAVQTKLIGGTVIDLDPAGRIRIDGTPIDAAPEHAGIYQSIMKTGTIPGLPGDQPTLVGPAPELPDHNSQFDAWELAAAAVGTAASKGVPISIDTVEYYNQVIQFPPLDPTTKLPVESPLGLDFLQSADPDVTDDVAPTRWHLDYSEFTYNRAQTYPGSVTWLDVQDLEWNVSRITNAVAFTNPGVTNQTLTGVQAFAQMADDTRAVILYLHDNEVVLPGFYMDPVGVDTRAKQLKAVTDPAVSLGELPAEVFLNQTFDVTASLWNPHAEATNDDGEALGGSTIERAQFRITVDAPEALTADMVEARASAADPVAPGVPVPFTVNGQGDLEGTWGPDTTGFRVDPGYHMSTTFDVELADQAPIGAYTVTLELVDLATGEALASDPVTGGTPRTILVNDDVATLFWADEAPSMATSGSYLLFPLRVFAPEEGPQVIDLKVTGPEPLAVGDVRVYGVVPDDPDTEVDETRMGGLAMTVGPDGTLTGSWNTRTGAGFTDVTMWAVVTIDAPAEGEIAEPAGFEFAFSMNGNAIEPALVAVMPAEEHGSGGGDDTTAPTVVFLESTLGADAVFVLGTEAAEADVTYECRLLKDGTVLEAWADCTGEDGSGVKSYENLESGDYQFDARATDKAGNRSPVASKQWRVGQPDTVPPTVNLVVNGELGSSASFTLTTDPAEDGVLFESRLEGGVQDAVWEDCTDGSVGTAVFTDLEPGSYVFHGRATDQAGNVSEPVTASWVVTGPDGPETTIVGGPEENGWVLQAQEQFQLASDIDGATFRVRVNQGEWQPYESPDGTVEGLTPGRNRIRFAAQVGDLVDATPAVRTVFMPRRVTSLERSAGWTVREGARHMFGEYVVTKRNGEVLRHAYKAVKRIALVAPTGEGFGKVHVYMAGRRITGKPIDLGAFESQSMRLIPVKTFAAARSGVVKIVVVSSGQPVAIDGLGIAAR